MPPHATAPTHKPPAPSRPDPPPPPTTTPPPCPTTPTPPARPPPRRGDRPARRQPLRRAEGQERRTPRGQHRPHRAPRPGGGQHPETDTGQPPAPGSTRNHTEGHQAPLPPRHLIVDSGQLQTTDTRSTPAGPTPGSPPWRPASTATPRT